MKPNDNNINTPCPLNPDNFSFRHNVKSPTQFSDWRKQILDFHRQTLQQTGTGNDAVAVPVPAFCPTSDCPLPLNVATTESFQCCDNVTRRRIEYDTTDGLRIPAYLFIPETNRPVPAVIVYHGHGEGKINAAENECSGENMLAMYLADTLGYVILAPDARTFGEFAVHPPQSHEEYYSGLMTRNQLFMTKLMEDGCRDMALLGESPVVDASRIGAAGISMGSWRTLNHAVLHENIRAAVVAGLYLPWNYLFSEKHCRCQHVPALAKKMAAEDLAATIFPRDLMIQWGLEDKYYQHDAEGLITRTSEIANFLGYSDHFTVDSQPGMRHSFSNPQIARFFHKRLGPGAWKPKIL